MGNYYVVEFDDGTKWTAKESDLPKDDYTTTIGRYEIVCRDVIDCLIANKAEREMYHAGYIYALKTENLIDLTTWQQLKEKEVK